MWGERDWRWGSVYQGRAQGFETELSFFAKGGYRGKSTDLWSGVGGELAAEDADATLDCTAQNHPHPAGFAWADGRIGLWDYREHR